MPGFSVNLLHRGADLRQFDIIDDRNLSFADAVTEEKDALGKESVHFEVLLQSVCKKTRALQFSNNWKDRRGGTLAELVQVGDQFVWLAMQIALRVPVSQIGTQTEHRRADSLSARRRIAVAVIADHHHFLHLKIKRKLRRMMQSVIG